MIDRIRLALVSLAPLALVQGCKRTDPNRREAAAATAEVPPIAPPPVAQPESGPALEAAAGEASGPAPSIVFDWGPPCRVPARQVVTKKGIEAVLTFDVTLEPRVDDLAVRLDKMKVVSVGGRDASDPAVAKSVGPVLAMQSALPTFVVARDGEYLGVEGMEATIDAVLAIVPDRGRYAAMMKSPEMQAMIERASGEHWNTWVGYWLEWAVPPGKPEVTSESFEMAPGAVVPLNHTLETLGPVKGAPALVLLRTRQLVDGPEATRGMIAYLRQMATQVGGPPVPADAISRFRRETKITVALDPATARPHRARYEMIADVDDKREVEVRDTWFDWSKAVGCVAAPRPR